MTGCKGYGLRGSDATTEIERTKEADTPGEIPGRSGLQADRREPAEELRLHGTVKSAGRFFRPALSFGTQKSLSSELRLFSGGAIRI